MDLDAVKRCKAIYDSGTDEAKLVLGNYRDQCLHFLEKDLPAIPEADRAAVAWYLSEVFQMLRTASVARVNDLLENSATGYALAAVSLLGWDKEAPSGEPAG